MSGSHKAAIGSLSLGHAKTLPGWASVAGIGAGIGCLALERVLARHDANLATVVHSHSLMRLLFPARILQLVAVPVLAAVELNVGTLAAVIGNGLVYWLVAQVWTVARGTRWRWVVLAGLALHLFIALRASAILFMGH